MNEESCFNQELTGELSKLQLRETDLKLTSEPPLLLDIENNEMHKVLVQTFTNIIWTFITLTFNLMNYYQSELIPFICPFLYASAILEL